MGLLGGMVKSAIGLKQKLDFSTDRPESGQHDQLLWLLKEAADTAFGKYYGFRQILESEDPVSTFQERVPIHQYRDMEFWWKQQLHLPDISWPGKPDYFALTSGTTSNRSKRIPVTTAFTDSMRKVGISLASDLPNFDLPEEVFESQVLMLSSSAELKVHEAGHQEGEISGINVHNFPGWYDLFYRPGKEIAAISNWDERVERIAEAAPEWNIGAIAGIPSWVLLMLKAIIEKHKLNSIREIWPNFKVYASGGVAFETYRKDFEAIAGSDLQIIDTYLASEGFFAYTARPHTMSMKLALSHGYFYEFIPFDERGVDEHGEVLENPEVHGIEEVKIDQDYVLVVSTCAGAWRYVIGDTIRFTQLEPHEIIISGRTKFFLNVVGSQLSEDKLDEGVLSVSEALEVSINEYMVSAMKDEEGEYFHQWVLVCDENLDSEKAKQQLDEALQSSTKNYEVARSKALKYIDVRVIDKSEYGKFLEATNKKGGQVKTPKVMKAEQMKELLEILTTD